MIQKLTRTLGLSIAAMPKGELYFSDDELKWAHTIRGTLPRNRPVAIVCTGSVTDSSRSNATPIHWQDLVDALGQCFTVVQIVVSKVETLEETIRITDELRRSFRPDEILDNCTIVSDPTARQLFSLFNIADLFLGMNSGCMHLAAAMDVPAIVVLPQSVYSQVPAFPDRVESGPWRHGSFLYPYHVFLTTT